MIVSRSAARRIGHRPAYGDILDLIMKSMDVAGNILGGSAAKTAQAQAAAAAAAAASRAQEAESSAGAVKYMAIAGVVGIVVLGGVIAAVKRPKRLAGYGRRHR
ncbi:MAG: hypothetical protein Q8R92_07805 [Deltaproteobacteria bacterium]|nr:hypothetical protein [Deltaproteobacteria bacterium]